MYCRYRVDNAKSFICSVYDKSDGLNDEKCVGVLDEDVYGDETGGAKKNFKTILNSTVYLYVFARRIIDFDRADVCDSAI